MGVMERTVRARMVMVKTSQGFALAIVPAGLQVNLDRIRALLGDPGATLAAESDLRAVLGDEEAGSTLLCGSLSEIPVYVEEELSASDRITFVTGNHHEIETMGYADFARVVRQRSGTFCTHAA